MRPSLVVSLFGLAVALAALFIQPDTFVVLCVVGVVLALAVVSFRMWRDEEKERQR